MPYIIIQPPFTLKFREMPKKELKAYFDWFLEQVPNRVTELESEVKATFRFADWQANKSPESLASLGAWFASQVETRPRTIREMSGISAASLPTAIPDEELTNRAFSLAMDAGMYLAETLRSQHPHLQWVQPLGDKKFVDYGQPVLTGLGPVPLNPVRILVTMAYGIADKKQDGQRLRSLYDYWAKQAANFKR